MIWKVALVQKKAFPNNVGQNLSLAVENVMEAKKLGADMVLFPEMWSIGYAPPFEGAFDDPFAEEFKREQKAWLEQAVDGESRYVKELQNVARRLQIGITATYLGKYGEKQKNTAIVIDRNGEIQMVYDKVHTCDFSVEALLEPGEEFRVCEVDGIKVGVMICYDREFPESARVLMLEGAEVILVPNACDMNPARLQQLSTRAFENMTGIAMANYPGKGWGCSCAFSGIVFADGGYQDQTLAMAEEDSEQIIIVPFDIGKIREYRQRETWGDAFRKPRTYQKLIEMEPKEPFLRYGPLGNRRG